jgi:hypothetical protein
MEVDDIRLKGMAFLRCRGMDLFAAAQAKEARRGAYSLTDENSLRTLKEKFIKASLVEAFTLHLVWGFAPTAVSAVVGAYRNHQRGEILMSLLSICALLSRVGIGCGLVESAFFLRLNQRLSEFEIRRVEADIRTISPNMIHRITARFKSLLHECHQVGNASHKLLVNYAVLVVNMLQLVGGIFLANMTVDEDTDAAGTLVPAWSFAAVVQPLLSLLVFLHSFGILNLAIERDIDQDIVEMNIRLTYSETHVPNWLLYVHQTHNPNTPAQALNLSYYSPPPPRARTQAADDLLGAAGRSGVLAALQPHPERRTFRPPTRRTPNPAGQPPATHPPPPPLALRPLAGHVEAAREQRGGRHRHAPSVLAQHHRQDERGARRAGQVFPLGRDGWVLAGQVFLLGSRCGWVLT